MEALGRIFDIVPVIVPVDLQAAQTGDVISLKGANHCTFVVFKAAGTAGDDPTFTVKQHASVGGVGKALAVVDKVFKKQGTLTAVGVWTKDTQAAAETYTGDGTSAESQGVYVIEVDAQHLDQANGYDCVSLSVGDVGGNAQLGCCLAILSELRFPNTPEHLDSAIVD